MSALKGNHLVFFVDEKYNQPGWSTSQTLTEPAVFGVRVAIHSLTFTAYSTLSLVPNNMKKPGDFR